MAQGASVLRLIAAPAVVSSFSRHLYILLLRQVPLSAEEKSKREQAPEKLAIGGDSGFQVDSPLYNIDKHSVLVLLDSNVKVPLPCPELPELVINAIDAIQVMGTSKHCFQDCTCRPAMWPCQVCLCPDAAIEVPFAI